MINFPKVELHVHLEGTIPSYLLCNLAQKNDMLDMLPSLHWIDKAQWSSPDEWIKIMHACSNSCIRTEHDYYFLTHHYLHELIKQNTIYCELSVSVNRSQKLNLDFRKIINSVSRAIQEVNLKNDIKVGIIAALTYGTSQTDLEMQIEQIISLKSSGIVGIDG
jgi:adenosine deaminase